MLKECLLRLFIVNDLFRLLNLSNLQFETVISCNFSKFSNSLRT